MTMRMYADLKEFPLEHIQVELQHEKIDAQDCDQCEKSEVEADDGAILALRGFDQGAEFFQDIVGRLDQFRTDIDQGVAAS